MFKAFLNDDRTEWTLTTDEPGTVKECFTCHTAYDRSEWFYFCNEKKRFYCKPCEMQNKTFCQPWLDKTQHEHFCIKNLKVSEVALEY